MSAVVADWPVLGVFTPGSHGSTFAGNPLACAIGRAIIAMLRTGEFQERSTALGARAGMQLDPSVGTGRAVSEALMRRRILTKETHGQILRVSPPLVIEEHDVDWAIAEIADTIGSFGRS